MAERLIRRGIDAERITITENWADGAAIRMTPFRRDGRVKLLYSGNLGLAYEFETLKGAMSRLRGDVRFQFAFNGGGARKADLERFFRGGEMANVVFGEFQPRERLGAVLAGCDVGLVTQRADMWGTMVPSKIYGILAAGRPLLFIGPAKATAARMIKETGCGWHIENGDVDGLVFLLQLLADQPARLEETGRRARAVFEERYDVRLGTERALRAIDRSMSVGVAAITHEV